MVDRKSILVRLPPAVKRGVDEHAKRLDISRNQIIVEAVTLYLEHIEKNRQPTRDIWWK